ncbi:hypothetical protein PILCRDRAFT_461876 [Piloderma croceum F 1598]|uniref:Fungal N-terminal domain-containing protein n=1 Tax=Piloderma croceum (strain F 1598) TaxID=765440 RepID=A0A0C3FCM9_PILCF|nr:hypothetical protein PILCRDRAFT_461876 [Piloderma croceum F 1598]
MDIIQHCLSLVPVPYLAPAFSIFKFIWSTVDQVQASKQQLEVLAQSLAQLLKALNGEYRAGRLLQARTSTSLADLSRLLKEISAFVQREASRGFLKLLFTKDQRIAQIEAYHRRITTSIESFQISALLDIHAWQKKNVNARTADQRALNERLLHLETNQQRLMEALTKQYYGNDGITPATA